LQRQNWVRAVPLQGGTSPTKNTSLSRCAVTCVGISLSDFEKIACYKFMTLACPNKGVDSKLDGINLFTTVTDVIDHFLGESDPSAVPIKHSF
jgi:hypothetical protein